VAHEVLRVATRGSALARWQADHVAALLCGVHPGLETTAVVVETEGDRERDRPVWAIGGRGVFVKEVQAAVLEGRADLAVHSAKDLPSSPALLVDGLVLAAVPERGDPRDALVGAPLAVLPPGGRVATGSARRRAQLAERRPDLTFAELRGNVDTRLGAAHRFAAVVVAAAALDRLGRRSAAAEVLTPSVMLPQVGQGALAVECRADDGRARGLLAGIDHGPSRRAVEAERGFLAALGGGCELPVGAYGHLATDGSLRLRALLATHDGRVVLREDVVAGPGADPGHVGAEVAGRLLDGAGGRALLDDLGGCVPAT
jgi:hydroxymethylbilane synthase